MEMNEYQELAMRTCREFDSKTDQLQYAVLGLNGEAGEVADKVKKLLYHKKDISYKEIADQNMT